MKKILIALIMFVSLNGFGQIVRTLDKVSNTTDTLKPISNAQRTVNTSTAASIATKQNALSGTGFVRISSGTISYDASTYLTSITSGNVTTALGFTPYNSTNPSAFISSISSANVTTALGFTPYNATNPSGYITSVPAQTFLSLTGKPTTLSGYGIVDAYPLSGNPSAFLTSITSSNVTTALGFTPYNVTNPSGYIPLTGLSSTATGLTYTNTTGVFSLTAGYVIPTSSQLATYLTTTAAASTYSPIASPIFTGDIEATTLNSGVIIKSPNGTRFRITISNTGDIIGTSL